MYIVGPYMDRFFDRYTLTVVFFAIFRYTFHDAPMVKWISQKPSKLLLGVRIPLGAWNACYNNKNEYGQ